MKSPGEGKGLVGRSGVSHDPQPILRLQQCAEALTNQTVIVDDQDLGFDGRPLRSRV
jgi:hypothetical protein